MTKPDNTALRNIAMGYALQLANIQNGSRQPPYIALSVTDIIADADKIFDFLMGSTK